jgi:hypothetical protein
MRIKSKSQSFLGVIGQSPGFIGKLAEGHHEVLVADLVRDFNQLTTGFVT